MTCQGQSTHIMKEKKKKNNYIDNALFYKEMSLYKEKYIACKAEGKEKPTPSNYIGKAIYDIATHYAERPNFNGYPFKAEMIGDAIENCFMYIQNFDHEKYSNPLAYFTQITHFAFVRRIKKEKELLATKHKLYYDMVIMGYCEGVGEEIKSKDLHSSDYMNDLVQDLDNKKEEQKKKAVADRKKVKVPDVSANTIERFLHE